MGYIGSMMMITFNYDRLKALRELKGLTCESFAEMIGVSAGSPKNWETGKTSPKAHDLTTIFNVFGVSPDWFWKQIPAPSPTNGDAPPPTESNT